MEQNTFSRIRLWCPRPFGTYLQNKQCCISLKKATGDAKVKENEPACSENTPPALPGAGGGNGQGEGQGEEGRVMLDTWYVIKPGNTKEKIAFFVAHQCTGGGNNGRSNAVKVKGSWGMDGTKPKRRRKSHDPAKGSREPCRLPDGPCPCSEPLCEAELVSVAEMVARVEQRSTATLRTPGPARLPPGPCGVGAGSGPEAQPPPSPPGRTSKEEEEEEEQETEGGGGDTSRVAEAIARIESAQRGAGAGGGGTRRNGLAKGEGQGAVAGDFGPCPAGEVRIAFRVASGGDGRSGSEAPAGSIYMSCNHSVCGGAVEKITCDLYQIVSPPSSSSSSSSSPLPPTTSPSPPSPSAPSLDPPSAPGPLARSRPDVEMATPHPAEESRRDTPLGATAAPPPPPTSSLSTSSEKAAVRDCRSGFHVEVVVTGGVDQCVVFGRDGAPGNKEDAVCVTVSQDSKCPACEEPPPGQLFFLHSLAQSPEAEQTRAGEPQERKSGTPRICGPESEEKSSLLSPPESDKAEAPLYCLYRHVSHDFLEIRFKIQRLLEPRQYLLLLPDHVTVKILGYLPTRALAALKCACHHFKGVIEAYGIRAVDSRWNRDPLYRDDPCKQCKKHYVRGDVSLCRWHPKPYHHDLPYGRSYWMCCRRKDRDTPGCRIGLHDNNWVQPSDTAKREEGR
ncbi:F-box only protein 46 [Pristis pectinata]|uniref:F-box only protein 46 n=1 Tax=Pristis pectinata TaxID=685728 RepID=UPI00223CB26E|nr:F-box only protein 46 [Pristis pectinata]XP_051900379.1 F-box only protein 46 [Pristis pectinata]XP_051900380.1 F-box only protein 46 [Pristis pectinata]XP_051900381.1 F-box only protein 46 [Pristis pectinata]XP_051900382.1 F-box only protein 46 [Pristis pectinata]XP_051900383.1 F-box only protein 46 [Pristis pectinata]XP_051900384.1 F-box only protein 46 [Pristis pectinata]